MAMDNVKKTRESGVELLRIIAALMVMALHINTELLISPTTLKENLLFSSFMIDISSCCVDIFILITGFYLSKTNKRTIAKPLYLILMFLLFRWAVYAFGVFEGAKSFDLQSVFRYGIPFNYFITLFVILYIISPYINLILSKLSRKGWIAFMVIVVGIFSIYATLIDDVSILTNNYKTGSSPITREGSSFGFNIVNFCLLYCIGAFINSGIIDLEKWYKEKKAYVWLALVVCMVLTFIWHEITGDYDAGSYSYQSPLVITMAVCWFMIFKNLHFRNRFINLLAKAPFAVFLTHEFFFPFAKIDHFAAQNVGIYVVYFFVLLCLLYLVGWVYWFGYDFVTKRLFAKLEKISIPYALDDEESSINKH